MKSLYVSALIIFLLLIARKGNCIEAYVQPVVFYTPNNQAYTEIRIFIHSNGITKIKTEDSTFIYRAVITLILKRGTDIINAERIILTSPKSRNPGPLIHQIRWPLDGMNFELETKIEDELNSTNELTLINKLNARKSNLPFLSEIQLSVLANTSTDSNHVLYKNGFYSEPIIYHQYHAGQNVLYAYMESYATQKLGKSYILKFTLSKKDSDGTYIFKEQWFKKRNSGSIDPFLLNHDISSLTSGTYQLTVQIINAKSEVQDAQSIEFLRENPFWDKIDELTKNRKEDKHFFDTLAEFTVDYSIRSMYPLISSIDASILNSLFKQKKMEEKRVFLFAYWSERSKPPIRDARMAFETHLELVKKIDKMFYSGFGYGFETDRGYIYLKYGIPDEVIAEDKDNGAFPYEIWKFNKIVQTGQTNAKFLFYNPDLAGSDFRLLHSTAHGERQNKRWEIELYKNVPEEIKDSNAFDAMEMQSNFNRRAREYFEY